MHIRLNPLKEEDMTRKRVTYVVRRCTFPERHQYDMEFNNRREAAGYLSWLSLRPGETATIVESLA